MTPLERAARAIFDIEHPPAEGIAWEELSVEAEQAHYVDLARAVLQALREPSKPMMDAGDQWTNHHADCVYSIWQAMLDRALSE